MEATVFSEMRPRKMREAHFTRPEAPSASLLEIRDTTHGTFVILLPVSDYAPSADQLAAAFPCRSGRSSSIESAADPRHLHVLRPGAQGGTRARACVQLASRLVRPKNYEEEGKELKIFLKFDSSFKFVTRQLIHTAS